MSDADRTPPDLGDLRGMARSLRELFEIGARTMAEEAGPSELAQRVGGHLGCELDATVLVAERFPVWEHVNLQRGVLNCSAFREQMLSNLCFNEYVKLAEWARANGVHPQTAYRWFRDDRMPVTARRLESGTIWVDAVPAGESGRVVVYARVSSHDQRHDLDRQVARLTEWATVNGHAVGEVVTEVGSGLNGKRPKLRRVLSDPSASVVIVEHRDRLARFGTEHLEAALAAHGRKIVVTDPGETTDDLVRDMIEVLTSMCARLYGRRGARNRAMRAVTAAKSEAAADG